MVRRAAPYRVLAVASLLALFVTWFCAFHIGFFEHADQSVFRGFADLGGNSHVSALATFVAQLCNVQPFVYLAAIPVGTALLRRRPRLAIAVIAILLGANVTTQLLKPLLAHPRAASLFGGKSPVAEASWPSGHATAAMSLALTSVLAAPGRLRPVVAAIGAIFAIAVSYSFLALGWHYPSDVVGGFLVATAWTMAVVAALIGHDKDRVYAASQAPRTAPAARAPLRSALAPPGVALLAACVLTGVVALARPHQVVIYAQTHEAFLIGASAIGVMALLLATGLMLALGR